MSLGKFAVSAPVKVTMIFVAVILLGIIALRRLPTNLFPDIRAPKVTTTVKTKGLSPLEVERRVCEPLERQLYTIRGVTDVETIARADSAIIITEFSWDTPLDFAFLDVKKAVADLQRERSQEIENVAVLRYDPNAAPVMTVGMLYDPEWYQQQQDEKKKAAEAGPFGKGGGMQGGFDKGGGGGEMMGMGMGMSQPEEPAPLIGSGPDLADLRRIAEQTLKPRFERLEGVANVVVAGGEEREIRISIDEEMLLQYNIDVNTVVGALNQENVNASGGYITEGTRRYLLKAVGEFADLEDIRRVVVVRKGESPVLVEDVADVSYASKDPKSVVFVDGKAGIGLAFYREAESNTVAVAESIRKEMDDIMGVVKPKQGFGPPGGGMGGGGPGMMGGSESSSILPPGVRLIAASDQSEFIQAAISEVKSDALVGGGLAVLVLLFFLRDMRTTLIITIVIPVSIIATFNIMYFQGLSLNLMTLGGLALSTGMLVDNAIVIIENIYTLRQRGMSAKDSALQGSKEVFGALLASTLTSCVVFLPIIYVKGVAGLLFKEQALTVAYGQITSLFVAVLLIPLLASKFIKALPKSMHFDESDISVPKNLYTRLLSGALRFRMPVLVVAAVLFGISMVALKEIPREFLPRSEQRQIGIRLTLPNGTPIQATSDVAQSVVSQVRQFAPALDIVYAKVGESEGDVNANSEDPDGPNTADIFIRLKTEDKPSTATLAAGLANFKSSRLVEEIKPKIEALPEVKAEFKLQQGSVLELLGTSGAPLLVEIRGEEVDTLTHLAEEAKKRLEATPGILNVRTNILEGSPEVRIKLDKAQLSRLGLEVQSVAQTLRERIDGSNAGQVKSEAGDLDIQVEVAYGRESLDTLRDIVIRTPDGASIPLRTISEMPIIRGPREIVRRKQERVARVMADLEGIKLSEGIARAEAALAPMNRPTGYSLGFTGEEQQRREAFEKLGFALWLSVLLVYMVMAAIFESFLQPFLILFTIPLAGVGVVGGFMAMGLTLNIMGIIGIVMLGGIVVNNAIVLLDRVNQIRDEHKEVPSRDTLIIGCSQRLRPVLMTTLATLLGLLPLAMGIGEGAELRQSMAVAVLGGLTSSTILTLFVIPICQSYLDNLMSLARRLRRKSADTPDQEETQPTTPEIAPENR